MRKEKDWSGTGVPETGLKVDYPEEWSKMLK